MALISASIPNLINGVSQQPPSLRLKTQAELQENGLSSVVNGLAKRPGTELVKTLGDIPGAENAFIHTMRRDENEYYTLIITEDSILVYDREGNPRTVTGDASYLASITTPAEQLAATTIADYTFILNKNVVAQDSPTVTETRPPEALVYVKQGDYTCKYTLKIVKGGQVYKRAIETMGSTQPDDATARTAERSIQTDRIAMNLRLDQTPDSTYYGGDDYIYDDEPGAPPIPNGNPTAITIPGIQYRMYGNVMHIISTDGEDFRVEVEDSRGNQHIFAFKGTAADFKKLPPAGPDGFVIGVVGDNDKGQDDYYVRLQTNDTGGQVWKETIKPGVKTSLDVTTLPHQLVSNADGSFTFQQAKFKDREVGDDETNPFPSFVGHKLNDIFFHRNRLGFLADENIVLSEAGRFEEFNFFKRTTLTLLDTDPIDAAVSNNKVSILKHAVPFNESLLLFSDLTQFRLTADDLLTPETVALDVTTQFEASLKAKPVGAGRYVFFATNRGKWSGIREYFVDIDAEVDDAADITAHVPEYIPGEVRKMEASSNEDMLLLLSTDDRKSMYVYSYYWQGTDKLQSSWSRWTFEGEILNISFNKSDIDILVKYETVNGPSLAIERINLSTDRAIQYTEQSHGICLDRRQIWNNENPLETSPIPTEGREYVFISDKGFVLDFPKAQNYVSQGGTVFYGVPFDFRYIFSEQVMKNNNEPMTSGRLQLRNMTLVYNDTGSFEVVVRPKAREESVNKFNGRIIGALANLLGSVAIETGKYRFPILAKSNEVQIEIRTDSHLPAIFQSAEWEGYFVMRSQRL